MTDPQVAADWRLRGTEVGNSLWGIWLLLLLLLALGKLTTGRLPPPGSGANTRSLLAHFYHTRYTFKIVAALESVLSTHDMLKSKEGDRETLCTIVAIFL